MTTVTGTITSAGGGRPHGAAVLITLVALDGTPVVGFVSPSEIVGQTAVPVGADGSWSVVLAPTAAITSPRGATLYRVDETGATGRARYYISAPASGTHWVGGLQVTLPGSAPEQLAGYLPLTGGTMSGPIVLPDASPAASEAYVASHGGGGGGGTPSGTVTSETSYGQAAAAGAATAYSRGDHTHGTPALPTPGAIGAATTDHTHPQYLTHARGPVYPLSAYGLLACSGDPENFQFGSTASTNTIFGSRFEIPAGVPVAAIYAAVRAGGTYAPSATPNQIGLYDDNGQPLGATADDSSLWTAAGWRGGALVGGTIAAQSVDRMAYLLLIFGGMSGVVMPYLASANDANVPWFASGVGVTKRRAFYLPATSLPASFNPATYGTPTTYLSLVGTS